MSEMFISDVIVGERARKDYGDLTDLIESIREHGVLSPIAVMPDHRLLCGGRRVEACRQVGLETIPFAIAKTQDDALAMARAERDENTCRKEMTFSEKVAYARKIEELEKPAAVERRAVGAQLGGEIFAGREALASRDTKASQRSPRSTELAAKAAGLPSAATSPDCTTRAAARTCCPSGSGFADCPGAGATAQVPTRAGVAPPDMPEAGTPTRATGLTN